MSTSSPPLVPVDNTILDNFIDVYGNRCRRHYFLALRFKRAIITYTPNTLDKVSIVPPHNTILVIRGKCPPLNIQNHSFLLFTEEKHPQGILITSPSPETLLKTLIPAENVLFSHFKSEVLYLVVNDNPFHPITQLCRKTQAFKALSKFLIAWQKKRPLLLEEIALLRFFKRYDTRLTQFNRWSSFAFELCHDACLQTTHSMPSAFLGKELYLILKRSELPPRFPQPPPEFYQCEILFTDTDPVGVAYRLSEDRYRLLEYVSPMVVSKPLKKFRDSSSVICNTWLPLYQNLATWQHFGLPFYSNSLFYKKKDLQQILVWLRIQTSEKYKLLSADLSQVAHILFGEACRSFLKD